MLDGVISTELPCTGPNVLWLKVLWTFKNIFETLRDLNDSDEKAKMLKTPILKFLPCQKLCKF